MSEENNQISNSKEKDSGAKLIFGNANLCAQLLRDYSNIEALKDVRAEDIEDVTERYIPMFTEERNADVVKKVRIRDGSEIFIALIEHKAQVDYNVCMQVLRYMVFIWEDYAKQQEKIHKGISKSRDFKYPPVFPIVYYNGVNKWTVDKTFSSRIALGDVFFKYIPQFEYHLVNTGDYNREELLNREDGLSLIMLINKLRDAADFNSLGLPKDYLDNIAFKSPEDVLETLARVIAVVLRKQFVPEDEIQGFVSHIKERDMSDLFEGWKGFNVQEERQKGKEIGKDLTRINLICKKLSKGKSIEAIASEIEEDEEFVKEISSIAEKYLPDYDEEKIYEEWKQKEIIENTKQNKQKTVNYAKI